MIDIYDEVGYIKTILEKGLSDKWERDVSLLVRYYKIEGKKKKEVKEIIQSKCEKYVKGYNKLTMFSKLNKIIEKTWKNSTPLREIREVRIPLRVINWFLDLENLEISEDQKKILQLKRKDIKISKKIFTFNRIKFLFTLYVWTKIQENYLNKPNVHYINNYLTKFKSNANLSSNFKFKAERNLLYDMGYIHINFALGVEVKFVDNFPSVFKVTIPDEEEVILQGEDLENCGYWLTKYRNGSAICSNCGKEYALKGKSNSLGRKRKYCYECAKKIKNNQIIPEIKRICPDCGKEFTVQNNRIKTDKCSQCYELYRKKYLAQKQRERKQLEENIQESAKN